MFILCSKMEGVSESGSGWRAVERPGQVKDRGMQRSDLWSWRWSKARDDAGW